MGYVSKFETGDFTPIGIDFAVKVVVGMIGLTILIALFMIAKMVVKR